MPWIAWQRYGSSCGAYRSVAFSARTSFVPTRRDLDEEDLDEANDGFHTQLSHSNSAREPLFVYMNCDFAE